MPTRNTQAIFMVAGEHTAERSLGSNGTRAVERRNLHVAEWEIVTIGDSTGRTSKRPVAEHVCLHGSRVRRRPLLRSGV